MPKDYKLHSKELQQEKEAKKHYFFWKFHTKKEILQQN
jgi:hypothetical protein